MKTVKLFLALGFAACLIMFSTLPASALNIVLTNDDGFESNNIQALFNALREAGHDVIMSAPYLNQSGQSGSVGILTPIRRTTQSSPGGHINRGAPGIGPTTIAEGQYYVDGSPVAAVLYGIDILAPERWGQAPDLVIAGPNEGNNLGLITAHSGTVGAAITAINKGIPAIAVSAFGDFIPSTPEGAQINAKLTVRLLDAVASGQGPLLPPGYGLNVNLPELVTGKAVDSYDYSFTSIGLASSYGLKFYTRLRDSAIATQYLSYYLLGFPGVSVEMPYTSAGYPVDNDENSEYNKLEKGVVTISLMQGTCRSDVEGMVQGALSKLLKPEEFSGN